MSGSCSVSKIEVTLQKYLLMKLLKLILSSVRQFNIKNNKFLTYCESQVRYIIFLHLLNISSTDNTCPQLTFEYSSVPLFECRLVSDQLAPGVVILTRHNVNHSQLNTTAMVYTRMVQKAKVAPIFNTQCLSVPICSLLPPGL